MRHPCELHLVPPESADPAKSSATSHQKDCSSTLAHLVEHQPYLRRRGQEREFEEDFALPSGVRGPVDFCALGELKLRLEIGHK